MPEHSVFCSFKIPVDLLKATDVYAVATERYRSQVLRLALAQFLQRNPLEATTAAPAHPEPVRKARA